MNYKKNRKIFMLRPSIALWLLNKKGNGIIEIKDCYRYVFVDKNINEIGSFGIKMDDLNQEIVFDVDLPINMHPIFAN